MPEQTTATQVNNETGFLNPMELLRQLGLLAGVKIADLGCGTGYIVLPTAKMVGAQGRVYAVDIRRSMLQQITVKAQERGLFNIQPVWADLTIPGSTKIPDNSVDAAFLVNVLFQLPKREPAVLEAQRIVRPGGKVVVVDWNDKPVSFGPAEDQRVTEEQIQGMFGKDFTFEKPLAVGAYHFGFVFVKEGK